MISKRAVVRSAPACRVNACSLVVMAPMFVMSVVFSGCGEPATKQPPAKAPTAMTSGTELETYLPLVDGHVLQFRAEDQSGNVEQLIARVSRTTPMSGELKLGSTQHVFDYTPDAIRLRSKNAVYLQRPIAVGTSWKGEHGCTASIAAIGRAVDVPAGHFEGCVEVVEPCSDGVTPAQFTTVLCPRGGIVILEVKKGAKSMRASLVSDAPAVDLGKEGVTRIQ